jgi:hypothetical protein
MSLKITLELLKLAHDHIEIKTGPYSKGKHALTLEKNELMLVINTGHEFKNFLLDEADLLKNPYDLIMEIKRIVEKPSINLSELN